MVHFNKLVEKLTKNFNHKIHLKSLTKMKMLLAFFAMIVALLTNAQDNKLIQFIPKFQAENVALDTSYIFKKDTIKIQTFKFYITDLKCYKNDSLVFTSAQKVYLIDMADTNSFKIFETKTVDFNSIKFNIGIDSLISVSGIFDGALDPTNGMYWTWQSGYINFKLEGISSICPARLNKFYWHIGGYMRPFNAQRELAFKTIGNKPLKIYIQLDELFNELDLSTSYQIMSPNGQAMQIANKLPSLFKISD